MNGLGVTDNLDFEVDWERLDNGPPEERVTFGALGIRCNDLWLTEAEDAFVNRVRQKVHLSAYPLAEWIAWNWWRLRWEPRRETVDWAMAHKTSTIGHGYVWPNITIASDGERVVLAPYPTARNPAEPLRYICHTPVAVSASIYEGAIDRFQDQVLGQLFEEGVRDTNLERIWRQVLEERRDPEAERRRVFEALLGRDPDEADDFEIERLVSDAAELGESGVKELAAASIDEDASALKGLAEEVGFESRPREAVQLRDKGGNSLPVNVAAWKRGVAAARSLREQEALGEGRISNQRLTELAGVDSATIESRDRIGPVTFALDRGPMKGSVVLRSRHETGRRFDVARLLGDRIAALSNGAFKPATRSSTYRQKLQRAFAGEFLCPFEALADRLRGDFSEEAIEESADAFNVSSLTVRTLLVNHQLIERDSLADRFELTE